jgi:hypothetical protein
VGLLEFDLVGHLEIERLPGQSFGGLVEPLDRRLESGGMIGVGMELDLQGQFHVIITDKINHWTTLLPGIDTRLLPTAKAGGFRRLEDR